MSDAALRCLARRAASSPESRAALVMAEVRAGRRQAVRLWEPFIVPGLECPECGCRVWGEAECFDPETREALVVLVRCDANEYFGNHESPKDQWHSVQVEAEAWARENLWVDVKSAPLAKVVGCTHGAWLGALSVPKGI